MSAPPASTRETGGLTTGRLGLYVLRDDDCKIIKIGKTTGTFKERRSSIESGPWVPAMNFVAGWSGVDSDETATQNHFKRWWYFDPKKSKEWFRAVPEITTWIQWMLRQPFVVTDESLHCLETPTITFDMWGPKDPMKRWPPVDYQGSLWTSGNDWWEQPIAPEATGDDYYTHKDVIEMARAFFGGVIDLDPASHPVANRVVNARQFFTIHDNGLMQPWAGKVWVNPPFNQWDKWGPKIASEVAAGSVEELIALCPQRSLATAGVAAMSSKANAICISTTGRWKFWGPKSTGSPDDGHALFYFGNRIDEFAGAFSGYGRTFGGIS